MDAYLLDIRPGTLCTNGYYGFEPPRVPNHSCVTPRTLRKRSHPDPHPEQTSNGFAGTGGTENGTWVHNGVILEAEKAKVLSLSSIPLAGQTVQSGLLDYPQLQHRNLRQDDESLRYFILSRLCPEHYHLKLQGVQVTTCRSTVSPDGVHNGEMLRQEECHGGVRTPSATSGERQMCPTYKPLSCCSHDATGSLPGRECPKCLAGDPGHLTHIMDCQQNSHMPMQTD